MIRLGKHIEILLLSNDCVIVPGFGGFMAHHVDARKDMSDGSFLPPMRSIGFNPKLTVNDSLLAQSYVEAYDISYPEATMRIEDEVRELRQHIEADGSYEFNGIGVISLNNEGHYEFAPCEAGILSPSLYGLDSFQMKTVDELRAMTKTMLEDLGNEEEEQAVEASKENEPTRQAVVKDINGDKHAARMIALWRNIAVACFAVILFLLLPSPLVNNAQFAGTHIDTSLLDKVMPRDITTGQNKVSESIKNSVNDKKLTEAVAKADNQAIANTEASEKAEQKVSAMEKQSQKGAYSIVVASHVTTKNANSYVNDLRSRGYSDAFVHNNGHVKVMLGHFATEAEAYKAMNKLNNNQEFAGAWVKKIE